MALDAGATRDFYNRGGLLAWDNLLGDWRDIDDVLQGSNPYATTLIVDDDQPGEIQWDVTSLVGAWVDRSQRNQGMLLRITSGGPSYRFRSREYPVPGERPKLEIVTSTNTFVLSPEADTYVAASTFQGFGDSEELRVSPSQNMLLRFDLTGIDPGADVTQATLSLWDHAEFGTGEVGVFRCRQGHDVPPSPPIPGLAAQFPGDVGIAGHPDVLLFSDFETDVWGDDWSYGTGAATLERVTSDPPRLFEPLQGSALRVEIPEGENLGMSVGFRFEDEIGTEPEEIYFRYYLRVADDWETVDGGKLPGAAGRYGLAGWGGRPSDGTNGWSARGLFRVLPPPGNPLADTLPIGNYVYHADMQGSFGDNHLWQIGYGGYLEKNRWYAIEQYLQMNTPGVQDGIMRTWVDGHLAWEKTDWRWRTIPALKIEEIWMNIYHGGTAPVERDVNLYIENVVIARQYIGPRVSATLFADGFESGSTAAWSATVP